jgi:hypothetical protein
MGLHTLTIVGYSGAASQQEASGHRLRFKPQAAAP